MHRGGDKVSWSLKSGFISQKQLLSTYHVQAIALGGI